MRVGLRRRAILCAALVSIAAMKPVPPGPLALRGPAPAPQSGQRDGAEAEALFVEAEDLLRAGDAAAALERLDRILADFPATAYPDLEWRAAARLRRGDLHWRSAEHSLAVVAYVVVIEEEPPSAWTSRARFGLARALLADEHWQAAADSLQRVVTAAARHTAESDPNIAADALRLLTLLHRFRLRPRLAEAPWTSSRRLAVSGLDLEEPVHIAASGDGQLLVIDEGVPFVALVDVERNAVSRLRYDDHGRPWWGIDGLPYLPTQKAGVIALGGPRVGFLQIQNGRAVPLKALLAGAREASGLWYLLDNDPERVLRFGPDGSFQGVVVGGRDRQPVDLAVDATSRLYVLDRRANAVLRFGVGGGDRAVVTTRPWRRAEALDVDGLGNMYVLDRDTRSIEVMGPDGQTLARLGPFLPGGLELRGPRDVAVDGRGRVYVVDRSSSSVVVIE